MRKRLGGSRTRRIEVEKEDGCETREAMIDRDHLLLATSFTFSFRVFYQHRTTTITTTTTTSITTTTLLRKIRGFSHLPRKERFSFRRADRGEKGKKGKKGGTLAPFSSPILPPPFWPSLCLNPRLSSRVSNERGGGERTNGFDKWLTRKKIRVDTSCSRRCELVWIREEERRERRESGGGWFEERWWSDARFSIRFLYFRITIEYYVNDFSNNRRLSLCRSIGPLADACFIGKQWVRYMDRLYEMAFQSRTGRYSPLRQLC